MKVFKFGGASVKDATAVRNLAKILNGYQENLVVVISAMGKTTDLLETLVKAYFGKSDKKYEIFEQFKNYHIEICAQLFNPKATPAAITEKFDELEEKLEKTPSLDYNFEYDQIVSFGELVSTAIVSDFLNDSGKANQWIDARSVIRTDDLYRDANID